MDLTLLRHEQRGGSGFPGINRNAGRVIVLVGLASIVAPVIAATLWDLRPEIRSHLTFFPAIGVALIVAGSALGTRWRRAGLMAALACAGQAATLELYHDTPWLQWMSRWRELIEPRRIGFTAILALQTCVVLWHASKLLRAGAAMVRGAGVGRWMLVVALAGSSSVCGARYVMGGGWDAFFAEMSVVLPLMLLAGLNLALVGLELPDHSVQRLQAALSRVFPTARGEASGVLGRHLHHIAAVWVFVMACVFSLAVFQGIPQLPDDTSMYWQAKYFAAGRLYLDAPPVAESFRLYLLANDGHHWYAHSTPGWPALLALGFLAGAPWIINPLIGAVTLLLIHRTAWRMYGWRTAQLAVLLLATSPWFLVLSASYMSHPSMLLWAVATVACVEAAIRRGEIRWVMLGGTCLGMLVLTRPFESAIVAPVVAAWGAWAWRRDRRLRCCAALAAPVALFAAVTLGYNQVVTGSWRVFPTTPGMAVDFEPRTFRLGFGPDIGTTWSYLDPLPGHGWRDVLINANQNLYWLSFETFGWACGSLVILLAGILRIRPRGSDFVWMALALANIAAYSVQYFSGGPDYGARYWYLCLPAIVLLSADWLLRMCGADGPEPAPVHARAGAALACAMGLAVLVVLPWRAVNKYPHRRGMQTSLERVEAQHDFRDSLVFIRPMQTGDHGEAAYRSALIRNVPGFRGSKPIYARDMGPKLNARLATAFPDRSTWLVEGPSELHSGYRIISRSIVDHRGSAK